MCHRFHLIDEFADVLVGGEVLALLLEVRSEICTDTGSNECGHGVSCEGLDAGEVDLHGRVRTGK